jgi:hypothetical protein
MAPVSQCQSIFIGAHGSDPSQIEAYQSEEEALHPSPEQLPLNVLLQETRQEIIRFRRKQKTSNMVSFEVFRRALLLYDDETWAGLYRLYSPGRSLDSAAQSETGHSRERAGEPGQQNVCEICRCH